MSLIVQGLGRTVPLGFPPRAGMWNALPAQGAESPVDNTDRMIQRLQQSQSEAGAQMARPNEQQSWKWDGNQVRYLTDDEQGAQDKSDRIAAMRQRSRMERAKSQRDHLRRMYTMGR